MQTTERPERTVTSRSVCDAGGSANAAVRTEPAYSLVLVELFVELFVGEIAAMKEWISEYMSYICFVR